MKIKVSLFFLLFSGNCYSQNITRKYDNAINWLIDSNSKIKSFLFHKDKQSTVQVDSLIDTRQCYFSVCRYAQYLGRPNLKKGRGQSIDSSMIKMPIEELRNPRIFYKTYYFKPFEIEFRHLNCDNFLNYKLIFSKPIFNVLTALLAPDYSAPTCEPPKSGRALQMAFIFNDDDEIIDYSIVSITVN